MDWSRRRGRTGTSRAVDFGLLPSGRNALIALVVGVLASVPFMNQTLFTGPLVSSLGGADIAYFVGFIVAAIVYWGLESYTGTSAVPAE